MDFRLQSHCRHGFAVVIILGLTLAACEPTVTPSPPLTPSPAPSSVTVLPITPVSPTQGTTVSETIPIENCAGNRDLEVSLSAVTSFGQNITLRIGTEVGTGVEVGVPPAAKVSLETKISSAYENQIQQAQSRTNEITYRVEDHSHVEYTVDWVETLYISSAQYELEGTTVSVPYTVTVYLPRPVGSAEIACLTDTFTSTPVPPPLDTPTNFPTPVLPADAPMLIDPPDNTTVALTSRLDLAWQWNGILGPNDYFQVEIWNRYNNFSTPIDVAWVKGSAYRYDFVELAFYPEYRWRISVVRGVPAREKDWSTAENPAWEPSNQSELISKESEIWTFVAEAP